MKTIAIVVASLMNHRIRTDWEVKDVFKIIPKLPIGRQRSHFGFMTSRTASAPKAPWYNLKSAMDPVE